MNVNIRKIIYQIVLSFFCVCGLIVLQQFELQADVTEKQIFSIHSMEDYLSFAAQVNEGNRFTDVYVNLETDLDFSETSENIVIGSGEHVFQGIFDGNGHQIYNLNLGEDEQGNMFYGLEGTVANLRIASGNISGEICGVISAEPSETANILNCINYAIVSDNTYDGFRGSNKGTVKNCYTVNLDTDVSFWNQGLCQLDRSYGVDDWFFWEMADGEFVFSEQTANTLNYVKAEIQISKKTVTVYAYYSNVEEAWCITLPAGSDMHDVQICVSLRDGESLCFEGNKCEDVFFEVNGISYHIKCLQSENIASLFVETNESDALYYLHADKENKLNASMILVDEDGMILQKNMLKSINGHGNDSWKAKKKSYNLEFFEQTNILNMGASEKYALLAGYRDNSLLAYKITNDLAKEIGMKFAPTTEFVQLYIDGNYLGMYFLTGKIEIGENRFNLNNLKRETERLNSKSLKEYERHEEDSTQTYEKRIWFDLEQIPKDITGGYILEMDKENYDDIKSRFVSERNLSMVMRSMPYASYEQVTYIADYWQEFEDALFAEDGYNQFGRHYSDYIDVESFADQWLFYELNMENSMGSSVYFYKESDQDGDGLLHASYMWDMEHSLRRKNVAKQSWIATTRTEPDTYWYQFYRHRDFAEMIYQRWKDHFLPGIEKSLCVETGENRDGISSFEWYQTQYGVAGYINYSRWDTCPFDEKLERIQTIYSQRKHFLTRSLSYYDSEYDYFEEEEGILYGYTYEGEKTIIE